MSVTTTGAASTDAALTDLVTLTVDGVSLQVPKGTLVIRAAELVGVAVPRFCDHPLLDPVAACRMCLVELEGQPKPQPACAVTVTEGMAVRTQVTSEVAAQAQRGIMEFLLINHPLDCPICDKGGECPLQNQAMANGRSESRFDGVKRTFPKPINVSAQILLDRERCVSCARCTRFAEQIAGDPFIELLERGSNQQIGTAADQPFNSYFSGNTVQVCPVGALTSARYRFRSRPFDLASTPTICEHCAAGCAQRTDVRRSVVLRRQAGDDPEVNEEWNCDKGRFAFTYLDRDRLTHPLVRDDDGTLVPASWPEALDIAARGLATAGSRVAVLPGGRLTREDAYGYAKFARVALGTDDIDFRARAGSAEEVQFLAALVAGRAMGPTYSELEKAPVVLLVGLEVEDEVPIVFLRLRKGSRRNGLRVFSIAPYASTGLTKLGGTLLPTVPGTEAEALDQLAGSDDAVGELLRRPGAVVLVGERLAEVEGGLSAAARLAYATGARLAWVPRRAGERGALDAGALTGLLPGGRPLTDPQARAEVAALWGVPVDSLPTEPGRDLPGVVAALDADAAAVAAATAARKDPAEVALGVGALVVGGVQAEDVPNLPGLLAALEQAPFVVSLEQRRSQVTERADVVFPVAVVTERSGSYLSWEGRIRRFAAVLPDSQSMTDGRVLALIADEMGVELGRGDVETLAAELDALGRWSGPRPSAPSVAPAATPVLADGEAVLATWRQLLDAGVLQQGEPFLAATARPAVARLSAATAQSVGAVAGDDVTVATEAGSITLPLLVSDLPDNVVWLPADSEGSCPRRTLGVGSGAVVRINAAQPGISSERNISIELGAGQS
ncbi:MAG TPA: NADH-quinone oxidoreductase subunit G [Candidatus Nanopelagicales bacterium]